MPNIRESRDIFCEPVSDHLTRNLDLVPPGILRSGLGRYKIETTSGRDRVVSRQGGIVSPDGRTSSRSRVQSGDGIGSRLLR